MCSDQLGFEFEVNLLNFLPRRVNVLQQWSNHKEIIAMKSRRIILSDDEDSPPKETSNRMFLSTPNASADLVSNMSNMNVRSSSKAAGGQSGTGNVQKGRVASDAKRSASTTVDSEEDTFNSSDELDPESTLRVMQGNIDKHAYEGDDYEAMIQPSNRSRTSKAAQQQSHSFSGKLRTSTDQQSQSSNQDAVGRPRRQSAVRAEQLLQNLYSEYDRSDRQNKEAGNDDDSYHSNSSRNNSGSGSNTDSDQTTEQREPEEVTTTRSSKGSNEFYWIDDSEETPAPRAASRYSSRENKKTMSSDHSKQSKHSSRSSASHRSRGSPVPDSASPYQPRRQSSRAASLSSKKEKDYLHAQQALRAASGLQSVLLSSSGESESESEHNASRRLSRQQQYSSDEDRPTSSNKNNSKSSSKKSPKTSYSFSMSQARSPAKKAVGLMYRNDEREEREDEYSDRTESDINDFIVNSDEERAEEEQREEELRLLREQKKAAKKRTQQEERRNKHNKSNRHTGKNAADVIRRATEQYHRGVSDRVNMNHEEESDEGEMQVNRHHNSSGSASKRDTGDSMGPIGGRKRKVIHDSSEEDNENGHQGDASADEGELGYMEIVAPKKSASNNNYNANTQATTSSNTTRNNATNSNGTASNSNRKQNGPMKDFIASDSDHSGGSHGEYNHDHNNNNNSDNSDSENSDTGGSSGGSSSEQSSAESDVDASDLDGPMLYYKVCFVCFVILI